MQLKLQRAEVTDIAIAAFPAPTKIQTKINSVIQGMDDQVVPHQMTDYVARILPRVVVHKLPNEGHFSYFFFCEECYRKMFLTIFESPHGPLEEIIEAPIEDYGYQEAANLAMAAE
ncbi:hypothetical protein T459_30225 [Capsicum annuum]|uniref:Uncharacterized protein n=1 Tax=Capsicum annuum TaxID=4072 RepID=A0A2G2Y7T8_CAPAN|nr:hypothetical protein T459_30225 [Capsicum annuum]